MARHDRTLVAVFTEPAPANLAWADIESLLVSRGAERSEGNGSRVRFRLNGRRAIFHRPHPQKEAGRGQVRSVRQFLQEAGVQL